MTPASLANVKLALVLVLRLDGPESIVVSGADVSTIQP